MRTADIDYAPLPLDIWRKIFDLVAESKEAAGLRYKEAISFSSLCPETRREIQCLAQNYLTLMQQHLESVHGSDWKYQFGFSKSPSLLQEVEKIQQLVFHFFPNLRGFYCSDCTPDEKSVFRVFGDFEMQYQVSCNHRFQHFYVLCSASSPNESLLKDRNIFPNDPALFANQVSLLSSSEKTDVLCAAAMTNYWEILPTLWGVCCDPNQSNCHGVSPIQLAVRCAHSRILALLIQAGASVAPYPKGGSLFLDAVQGSRYCDADIIKVLLIAGADPMVTDNKGKTPLEILCKKEFSSYTNPGEEAHRKAAIEALKRHQMDYMIL